MQRQRSGSRRSSRGSLQGAIDAYGSQGGGGAAAPRATSAAPTQRRRKKKGNAASHLSVSVRASMLEAKKLSGFAPNLHGRTMPARYGKDSKQTITVGRGSRYAVAHYPTMDAAAEDNFEGKLYSGVGKQTSSTLQSSPFTHLGSATRKDNNNRGFLSEEAPPAAGAEGTARQNPGPTFKYTACAPQYDSEKRSMPCGVFGQDNRCGLDEMFMDQLQVHKSRDVQPEYARLDIAPVYNVGYSPELNPIEAVFSKVKAVFSRGRLNSLVNKTGFNFDRAITAAFRSVTPEHCAACVRKSLHLLRRAAKVAER